MAELIDREARGLIPRQETISRDDIRMNSSSGDISSWSQTQIAQSLDIPKCFIANFFPFQITKNQ